MASVTFVLKTPKSKKISPIIALIRFNNRRIIYSTGYSINPDLWDSDSGYAHEKNCEELLKKKIKLTTEQKNIAVNINSRINKIKSRVSAIFTNLDYQKISPSAKIVRYELDKEFREHLQPEPIQKSLNKYLEDFVKEIDEGDRLNPRNGKRYAHGTVKIYKGLKTMFIEYQKKRRVKIDYEDIDMDFYNDFVKFFNEKNYSTNTIGRHIKTLKVILGAAQREKLHSNTRYLQKDFRGLTEKVANIYLSLEELEKIYKAGLKGNKEREEIRDVFLVGCFTALRYSDYSRLKPHHIQTTPKGTKVIKIITKKTGQEVIIPIWHWMLEEILEKYPKGMPKTYEQKVNDKIKDIGSDAKIKEKVNRTEYKKGVKYEVTTPKHRMIKTHTARRSGATNMYKHGIPAIDIMKITGHTTEKNFLKYIMLSNEEVADRIANDFRIYRTVKKA